MDPTVVQGIVDRLLTILIALVASGTAGLFTFLFFYLAVVYAHLKKREQISMEMVTLEIKISKDNEIKIDAADQMFAAFASLKKGGWFSFLDLDDVIAFEIVGKKAEIHFYVSAPSRIVDLVEKTIYGYYPSADIKRVDEPNIFTEDGKVVYAGLVQKDIAYMPLKAYKDIPTDPLSAITSALSKMDEGEGAMVQILIRPSAGKWKKLGKSYVSSTKKNEANPEKATFKTDPKTLEKIEDKKALQNAEAVIVLRILHNLGYIGENAVLQNFIKSPFESDIIFEVAKSRNHILREINKALKETHL